MDDDGPFRNGGGGAVWVPPETAASSPTELPGGYDPLYTSVSNGPGAGFSTEQALLQCDGNSMNYRALDQGVGVDLFRRGTARAGDGVVETLCRCGYRRAGEARGDRFQLE